VAVVTAEPELRVEVDADSAGLRLDQFLAAPLGSRSRAARLIEAGLVSVDGKPAPKRHLVTAGEAVIVAREPISGGSPTGKSGSAPHAIAYEDEHLVVVDKPAGVVVHPARGHQQGTLAQALAGRAAGGEDPFRAGIVHRLDRDTSGLLVVAKSDAVHRKLKAELQARAISREYLALVHGRPSSRTGTIDAPIGRDRRDRTINSLDTDIPRDAVTHFEIEEALPRATLLRVSLETGRTHQIRVHMKAIGHPVLGDPSYGPGFDSYGLRRQFLHAARLAFPHPVTGDPVDLSSPLPDDLAEALELARHG
jgi:23S rRNA pseudouridine1911/1915/1917 synthase